MKIAYQLVDGAFRRFPHEVKQLIERHRLTRVCDIGGGANPILDLDYISNCQLQYTLLDISQSEMEKAPAGYRKILADICDPKVIASGPYDFAFSCMVAEHIPDAKAFHTNVFKMLAPGGVAFHYFPTLFALPFFVNKVIPENLGAALLNVFAPRDRYQWAKFPALYHWTFGPTRAQIHRLTDIGYDILEYRGFFGHVYFDKVPFLRNLHRRYSNYLVRHPNAYLTSFAYLIMQKPGR